MRTDIDGFPAHGLPYTLAYKPVSHIVIGVRIMKKFASLVVFVFLLSSGGVATAADVTVSDPYPEGTVLNPAAAGDTIIFGDVSATIISNEVDEDGNRTVQLEIENSLRTALWIEPTYLLSFGEGRFLDVAGADDGSGPEQFTVVEMTTETGTAEVAYEWFMSIESQGTGVVTLQIGSSVEKLCYKPYASNVSGLLSEEDNRIHGCWLLDDE